MKLKNKWGARIVAMALTVGMTVVPMIINSGVTYADMKELNLIPTKASRAVASGSDASGSDASDSDASSSNASIQITEEAVSLVVGEKKVLKVIASPSNATVTWDTSDANVATVEADGTVTAVAEGTATITAELAEHGVSASCQITVTEEEPTDPTDPTEPTDPTDPTPVAPSIQLDQSTITIEKDQIFELNAVFEPADAEIVWASADEKIATVKGEGKKAVVTAVEAGKTVVTAAIDDVVASCEILVVEKAGETVSGESTTEIVADLSTIVPEEAEGFVRPEGVTDEQIAAIQEVAANTIQNDILNNQNVSTFAAGGLTTFVEAPVEAGQTAVLRVGASLQDVEMVMENIGGQVVIKPSKLVYDANIFMNVYDEDGKEVESDVQLSNADLKRNAKITFRLAIPSNVTGKYAQVKHISDEKGTSSLSNVVIRNAGEADAYIELTVPHFSTFELTFTEHAVSNYTGSSKPTPAGKGGSYTTTHATTEMKADGQWIQNENGWWYRNANGTWPANCWSQLTWNNQSQWYRFNEQGYMVSGWFTDVDGNRYFLHNVPDGTQGYMYTGWKQINGVWYYFRENVGGPQGSLMLNGTAPDGNRTDANGVWIQ